MVIRGRSNIVGKPLAMAMTNVGATVSVLNSKTPDGYSLLQMQHADVVVLASGNAKDVAPQTVQSAKYVIDVTIANDEDGKLCGEFNPFAGHHSVNVNYTSVPGGVGLLTCAALASNLMDLAEKRTFDA